MRIKIHNRFCAILMIFFLLLIFISHALIYFKLNLNLIDSDQPFLWLGTADYSKGLFYEPRFYGQDYGTFLEPLIAVPFVWLHMPVYYALPLATHLLFLFPFLFTAFYLYWRSKKENALVILMMMLCMTTGYDILNSIPRGFVTGLFFTSFFIISVLDPLNLRWLVINTLFGIVAYYVNPNSLIVTLPFSFYLFLHHFKNPKYYLVVSISLLAFIPVYFLLDYFYAKHPEYTVYWVNQNFSLKYLYENISNLDQVFSQLSFFTESSCLPLLLSLIALQGFLFYKNRKGFWSFVIFLLIILLAFLSGKTREGADWPFYAYSRMYLGIPIVICLLSALIRAKLNFIFTACATATLIFSGCKFVKLDEKISDQTEVKRWMGVHLVNLDKALDAIRFYRKINADNKTDFFLVSNGFWLNTFLVYGGPAVFEDFPQTQETRAERRYWVREFNKEKVIKEFTLISAADFDVKAKGKYPFEVVRIDDYGLFLVKNNRLKMKEMIAVINDLERK